MNKKQFSFQDNLAVRSNEDLFEVTNGEAISGIGSYCTRI